MKKIILRILGVTTISLSLSSVSLAGTFDPNSLIPPNEGKGTKWSADSTKGAQVSLDVTTENPKTTFKEGVNNTEGEHVLVGFAAWCTDSPVSLCGDGEAAGESYANPTGPMGPIAAAMSQALASLNGAILFAQASVMGDAEKQALISYLTTPPANNQSGIRH